MIRIKEFPTDLDYFAKTLRDDFIFKKRYKVLFDFKMVSDSIRNYAPFRETMIRMLYKKDPDLDIDALVEIVRFHSAKGKCPNFSKTDDPKSFQKITNYINSISGQTLSESVILELCKRLTSF